MPKLLFANNAASSLAGSISNSSTVANLQSGTGVFFPAPAPGEYFVATFTAAANPLLREIVWVTNVVGDTVTMIRAQEGTTALNWLANDLFDNLATAGQMATLLQIADAQAQTFNYAVDIGSANAYQCVLTPALLTPVNGMPVRFLVGNTNTGPSTLNPGSGAAPIYRIDGTACVAHELIAGTIAECKWNSGLNGWQLSAPGLATNNMVSVGTDTGSAVSPAQLAAAVSSIPSGVCVPYAGSAAPATWLFAAGQAVSRTTFSALFAAIGVVYGVGDGSTTFNLPDLRGRVAAAADNMGGSPAGRLGGNTSTGGITVVAVPGVGSGEQSHTPQLTETAAHTHSAASAAGATGASTGGPVQSASSANTGSAGGGQPFNVTQPTLVMNYIIKE